MSSYQDKQFSNSMSNSLIYGVQNHYKGSYKGSNTSADITGMRALDSTVETIKTHPASRRTDKSPSNLSASFTTGDMTNIYSKASSKSFMKPTKSSRSKFTVR